MPELISVIIPVHNSALHIEKCVESILQQTYEQVEVLLVDDGSTDDSLTICKQLEQKDERVRVFEQENRGPVKARKTGILNARGSYLAFVDSDDWIEADMYERLLQVMQGNKVQIVCAGYYRDTVGGSTEVFDKATEGYYEMSQEAVYQAGLFIREEDGERKISSNLWSKLFERALMEEIFMRLDDKMCYAEDVAAVYSAIAEANAIYVLHEAFYHYVAWSDSIVNSYNKRLLEQINLVALFLESEFDTHRYKKYLMREKDLIVADCLFKGLNSSFFDNQNIQLPTYMVPEFELNYHMTVGIYGAGKVGKCYYNQLINKGYEKIVLIDRKASIGEQKIITPDCIEVRMMDIIIIAVREPRMADSIKQELIEKYGVAKEKIVWKAPISFLMSCKVRT